eukprot:1528620-Prymnesium_polylepis.1
MAIAHGGPRCIQVGRAGTADELLSDRLDTIAPLLSAHDVPAEMHDQAARTEHSRRVRSTQPQVTIELERRDRTKRLWLRIRLKIKQGEQPLPEDLCHHAGCPLAVIISLTLYFEYPYHGRGTSQF